MKSILGKAWLGITSLVLIILLIIWLFQIGLLNNFYITERSDLLLEEGNKLAALFLESSDYNTVSQDLITAIDSFAASYGTRILIIDPDSNILFFNVPKEFYRNHEAPDEFFRKSLAPFYNDLEVQSNISKGKSFVIQKTHSRFNKKKSIVVGVPIKSDGRLVGNILLTSPLAPIEETISILKKQLSIITLISLIIGTLLALLFAKHFTKPIRRITETARKIAKGDFTANVKLSSKDEIGDLGNTINDMSNQLGQIENFRREFIANTTHELKTPISLIRAYAELVKDTSDKENFATTSYLQVIIDESDRLNDMVEDILYLSKMESGYSKLNQEVFPIVEVISNVIDKLSFFSSSKNIDLILEIDDNETTVYADKEKFHQVFYNIINNAINYSYENSQVILRITDIEDNIRIEIIDTGKGIPKEDLPYIWDRFYKVDKSRKRDDSGTGLGMAIVKNVFEAHNFKYGVRSKVDKGTTVWFEMNKNA